MRQIGTLPEIEEARRFSDYLLTLGMSTRLDQKPDGCAIWIVNEDHVDRARQELETFRNEPGDARYRAAESAAKAVRRESEKRNRQFRKNYREMRDQWDRPNLRRRPLTFLLIVLCVIAYLLPRWHGLHVPLDESLQFSTTWVDEMGRVHSRGLDDILHGQVWRLVTPIFLHYGRMHIFFNMYALAMFGSLIEIRRGTRVLAALVFLSAIVSNVGQYLYLQETHQPEVTFGGMSGVIYALFGYVWVKGQNEPEQGMILHPTSISMMLLWLVLCMMGYVGNIANAAHLMGLVMGVLLGLSRI